MKTNLVLIGMPGAGKSTLGVLAAKALGMDFLDTDLLIQQSEGRLLQEIIDTGGIRRLLDIEQAVLCALRADHTVIATGGSAVYSKQAMITLQQSGLITYLHVPYEEIEHRVTNIQRRGIALPAGVTLRALYNERLPLYRRYAEITVNCAGGDIERCVGAIADAARLGLMVQGFPPRTTA